LGDYCCWAPTQLTAGAQTPGYRLLPRNGGSGSVVVVGVVVVVRVVVVVGLVVDRVVVVVGAGLVEVDLAVVTWHASIMNSDTMASRSLKSATVKTVLRSPGGDAIPRSSSSFMSRPMPKASHTHTRQYLLSPPQKKRPDSSPSRQKCQTPFCLTFSPPISLKLFTLPY